MPISLRPDDALIVVDMQNDFLPGGALAVSGGDEIVEPIEALAASVNAISSRWTATACTWSTCPSCANLANHC